jgi:hypothetical protein
MRGSRPGLAVVLIAIGVAVAACGRPVFTETVRQRYNLDRNDFRRVQFFTSDEIVLRRELLAQDKGDTGGELIVRGGVRVEEIVIRKHTPCVAIRFEGDYVLVSFSRRDPTRALWFGIKRQDDSPVADARRYQLVALDNPREEDVAFQPQFAKGFLVTYAGNKYQVVDGAMWDVHLLYEIDETFASERVQEKPDGWKLSEGIPPPQPPPPPPPPSPSSSVAAPAPSGSARKLRHDAC